MIVSEPAKLRLPVALTEAWESAVCQLDFWPTSQGFRLAGGPAVNPWMSRDFCDFGGVGKRSPKPTEIAVLLTHAPARCNNAQGHAVRVLSATLHALDTVHRSRGNCHGLDPSCRRRTVRNRLGGGPQIR